MEVILYKALKNLSYELWTNKGEVNWGKGKKKRTEDRELIATLLQNQACFFCRMLETAIGVML